MVVPKADHRTIVLGLMKQKDDLVEQINVLGQTLRQVSMKSFPPHTH